MSKEVLDKIDYMIALIAEFANTYGLSSKQAYEYLQRYEGLNFVDDYYDVEHTLSFDDAVNDLTIYCKRMGGRLG